MKKLLSFILALIFFTCGVVGTSLAQPAAPAEDQPAAAAEQAAPKKAKKAAKHKKAKKKKKAKKATCPATTPQ